MRGQYFGRRETQDCPLTVINLSTVLSKFPAPLACHSVLTSAKQYKFCTRQFSFNLSHSGVHAFTSYKKKTKTCKNSRRLILDQTKIRIKYLYYNSSLSVFLYSPFHHYRLKYPQENSSCVSKAQKIFYLTLKIVSFSKNLYIEYAQVSHAWLTNAETWGNRHWTVDTCRP